MSLEAFFLSLCGHTTCSVLDELIAGGAIAKQARVTGSYVALLVYLCCHAPDSVKHILRRQHPLELVVKRLIGMCPLPLNRKKQRVFLEMMP
jgi:hypothetical protein